MRATHVYRKPTAASPQPKNMRGKLEPVMDDSKIKAAAPTKANAANITANATPAFAAQTGAVPLFPDGTRMVAIPNWCSEQVLMRGILVSFLFHFDVRVQFFL